MYTRALYRSRYDYLFDNTQPEFKTTLVDSRTYTRTMYHIALNYTILASPQSPICHVRHELLCVRDTLPLDDSLPHGAFGVYIAYLMRDKSTRFRFCSAQFSSRITPQVYECSKHFRRRAAPLRDRFKGLVLRSRRRSRSRSFARRSSRRCRA